MQFRPPGGFKRGDSMPPAVTPLIRKAKLTMAWALFLLAFLTYCSGVHSQSVTQPASASVSLGQTVKLSCTESSGGTWGYFNWYQQRPGQAPRFLWHGTGSRGEGVPDRFTGSYSGKTGSLTITNVQAEDEADYYCGNVEGTDSGFKYIFGSGTHLEVTTAGQPAVPPKVHLFPPSSEELTSKRKGTLVCLIDDFIPGDIDVTWLADGSPITSNVETTRPTKRNDKYVASSYLSLTAAEYEEKDTFTCKVTHDSKDYQKSVQRAACSA